MPSFVYTQTNEEIAGDAFTLTADLLFDVEIEHGLNADIGGINGREATKCDLLGAQLDGFMLPKSALIEALGETLVEKIEQLAFEQVAADFENGEVAA